ncbi:hypothetical protein V8C40DRAFT_241755 [Trichoderma camerunense]
MPYMLVMVRVITLNYLMIISVIHGSGSKYIPRLCPPIMCYTISMCSASCSYGYGYLVYNGTI